MQFRPPLNFNHHGTMGNNQPENPRNLNLPHKMPSENISASFPNHRHLLPTYCDKYCRDAFYNAAPAPSTTLFSHFFSPKVGSVDTFLLLCLICSLGILLFMVYKAEIKASKKGHAKGYKLGYDEGYVKAYTDAFLEGHKKGCEYAQSRKVPDLSMKQVLHEIETSLILYISQLCADLPAEQRSS